MIMCENKYTKKWAEDKKKTGIFRSFCNALKINYLFFLAAFLAAAASVASYMTGVPIMMEA